MMKLIVFTLAFYLLLLWQESFLAHFSFLWGLPSLVIVTMILINLFEEQRGKTGLILAVPAGLLLDLHSGKPFGLSVLLLLTTAFLIKLTVKRYVRVPFAQRP